jgi:drug/metabolite transporter (DMT)-like permease
MAAAFTLTALLYLPLAVVQLPRARLGESVLGAILILTLVCTALGFLLFYALIAEVGPVRATVITYINPAVAVTLGVLLLHERFTLGIAVGFALVLTGSVLATGKARQPARPHEEPAPVGAPG